ncbi:hypothetical protein HN51_070611 [Arachis hypogaea]
MQSMASHRSDATHSHVLNVTLFWREGERFTELGHNVNDEGKKTVLWNKAICETQHFAKGSGGDLSPLGRREIHVGKLLTHQQVTCWEPVARTELYIYESR